MGELRLSVRRIGRFSKQIVTALKSEPKCFVRFVLYETARDYDVQPAAKYPTAPFVFPKRMGDPTAPSIPSKPTLDTLKATEVSSVRFDSIFRVEFVAADKVLAQAALVLENQGEGQTHHVRLSLYHTDTSTKAKDDDAKAVEAMEMVVDVTPLNFCPSFADIGDVNARDELESPFRERLRLLFTIAASERLPNFDIFVAAARRDGWERYLAQLKQGFRIVEEPVVSNLRIKVIQGHDMPREGSGFVDPYVILTVHSQFPTLGESFQTVTKKDLPNPVFNETFDMRVLHGAQDSIRLTLWDYDEMSADDLIGDARLPLGLLVKGIPLQRQLVVWKRGGKRCSIDVEVTALDFGLDPNPYEPIVDSIVKEFYPRLRKFYEYYASSKVQHIEEDLITYGLDPLGQDRLMAQLIQLHGLEPDKNTFTFQAHSVQDISVPGTRRPVNWKVGGGHWKGPLVRVVVDYYHLVNEANSNITANRVVFTDSTTRVVTAKPWERPVTVRVYIHPKFKDAKQPDDASEVLVGTINLSLKQLQRGVVQGPRTYPLVHQEVIDGSTKNVWNGSITLSMVTQHFGNDSALVPSLSAADEEVWMTNFARFRKMIRRYRNSELMNADVLFQDLVNPEQEIQRMIDTLGPEPGTYLVRLTIEKAENLPRVEFTGAGVDAYVRVDSREDVFATQTISSRSPTFGETFVIDVRDPAADNIALTVMDYDSNSEDDVVATALIPIFSLSRTSITRTVALERPCGAKSAALLTYRAEAVGFGPIQPILPPDVEQAYRAKLYNIIQREASGSLKRFETIMWAFVTDKRTLVDNSFDQVQAMERYFAQMSFKHGLQDGVSIFVFTIHSLDSITREKPFDKRSFQQGKLKPAPGPDVLSITSVGSYAALDVTVDAQGNWTPPKPVDIDFDAHHPWGQASVAITLGQCGSLHLSLRSLMQAVLTPNACPVLSQKWKLPLIRNADSMDSFVAGWITFEISTKKLIGGPKYLAECLPVDYRIPQVQSGGAFDTRAQLASRVTRLLERGAPSSLTDVQPIVMAAEQQDVQQWERGCIDPLIKQYGAEPGTTTIELKIIGLVNVPSIELGGGDPYVVATLTSISSSLAHYPTSKAKSRPYRTDVMKLKSYVRCSEVLCIDIDNVHYPDRYIDLTLMDYDANSKDDEWCRARIPLSSLFMPTETERYVAVTPVSSLLKSYQNTLSKVKDRATEVPVSTMEVPMIGFTVVCKHNGAPLDSSSAAVAFDGDILQNKLRPRVFKLLHRHQPTLLDQAEVLLWKDFKTKNALQHFDDIQCLVRGNEERCGIVTVTIHKVTKLTKENGDPCRNAGNVYVTILAAANESTAPVAPPEKMKTKQKKAVQGTNHTGGLDSHASATFDETFLFDFPNPALPTNLLEVSIRDDVVGDDVDFGSIIISLRDIVRDAAPIRRRYPVVQKARTFDAFIGGYVELSLSSNFVSRTTPLNEEAEVSIQNRLFAMVMRYDQCNAHTAFIYPNTAEEELNNRVRKHGPEPGTYRVRVTVVSCADLPKIQMIGNGCDPYVTVSGSLSQRYQTTARKNTLNPKFDESFDLDIVKPTDDIITIRVFDDDGGGVCDAEVGCVSIPVTSFSSSGVTRTLPLSLSQHALKACKATGKRTGSVTVTLQCFGFEGTPSDSALEAKATATRDRIVALEEYYLSNIRSDYERNLWQHRSTDATTGGLVILFDQALQEYLAKLGPEPGSRQLSVTIHSLENLQDEQGKPRGSATPYVTLTTELAKVGTTTVQTDTLKPGGATHPKIEKTFSFELNDVVRGTVEFKVFDDVVGSDYEFGSATMSVVLLQQNVARKRTLPLYRNVTSSSKTIVHQQGSITVSFLSTQFGFDEAWNLDAEKSFTARLTSYFLYRAPQYIQQVDQLVGLNFLLEEAFMKELIKQHGVEMGTHTMRCEFTFPIGIKDVKCSGPKIVSSSSKTLQDGSSVHTFELDCDSGFESSINVFASRANGVLTGSFSNSLAANDGCPLSRTFLMLPLNGLDSAKKDDILIVPFTMVTTTCGSRGNRDSAGMIEVENTYRDRMINLLLRSGPSELIHVNDWVLGKTEHQLKEAMQRLITLHGTEPGQTTLSFAVRGMDDLPGNKETNVYAKVYFAKYGGVTKSLLAETRSASVVFSNPVDCLRPQDDIIVVKLATVGVLTKTVLGKSCFPVNLLNWCRRLDNNNNRDDMLATQSAPKNTDVVLEIPFWCFDQTTQQYVGRVTVLVATRGLSLLHVSGHNIKGLSTVERVFNKEMLVSAWRAEQPPSPISEFVPRKLVVPSNTTAMSFKRAVSRAQFPAQVDYFFVHIVACRGLPQMDFMGTSDTFIELEADAMPHVTLPQKTNIVSGTLNPVFRFDRDDMFTIICSQPNEMMFTLSNAPPPSETYRRVIRLVAKDKDPGSEEVIGTASLSADVLFSGIHDVDFPLFTSQESREAWVLANESKLLRVPLCLNTVKSKSQRGEILLATSSSPHRAHVMEPFNDSTPVTGFMRAMENLRSLTSSCSDLEAIHLNTFANFLCRTPVPGTVEQQLAAYANRLRVQYGTRQ